MEKTIDINAKQNNLVNGFKSNFGSLIYAILSVYSIQRVLQERPVSGHYRIFTGAARLLWSHHDPYEFDFHSVGVWFYSPSCAMFFFSLFSWLPDFWGLLLYSLLSVAAVWAAITYFFSNFYEESFVKVSARKELQWTFAIVSLQVFQAVLAAKIEMVMIALILVCAIRWLKQKDFLASFLFAMTLEWKFQPLPMLGLLLVGMIAHEKRWKPIIALILSYCFWHLLPILFLGLDFWQAITHHMNVALAQFVSTSYTHYDNLFKFIAACGWELSFSQAMVISLVVGMIYFIFMLKLALQKNLPQSLQYLTALSLGSVFVVTLSPMAQNNGSILWVPLLILMIHLMSGGRNTHSAVRVISRPKISSIAGIFTIVFFCFAYSDLMPANLRTVMRDFSLKSLVLFVYSFWLVYCLYKKQID